MILCCSIPWPDLAVSVNVGNPLAGTKAWRRSHAQYWWCVGLSRKTTSCQFIINIPEINTSTFIFILSFISCTLLLWLWMCSHIPWLVSMRHRYRVWHIVPYIFWFWFFSTFTCCDISAFEQSDFQVWLWSCWQWNGEFLADFIKRMGTWQWFGLLTPLLYYCLHSFVNSDGCHT